MVVKPDSMSWLGSAVATRKYGLNGSNGLRAVRLRSCPFCDGDALGRRPVTAQFERIGDAALPPLEEKEFPLYIDICWGRAIADTCTLVRYLAQRRRTQCDHSRIPRGTAAYRNYHYCDCHHAENKLPAHGATVLAIESGRYKSSLEKLPA